MRAEPKSEPFSSPVILGQTSSSSNPVGGSSHFTPCPDMQAGRASAIGSRSAAFPGRTHPSMRPGTASGLSVSHSSRLVGVLGQCPSTTTRLPPAVHTSELLSVTPEPRSANLGFRSSLPPGHHGAIGTSTSLAFAHFFARLYV